MPNQSLCLTCRYRFECEDFIADRNLFVVQCDKYRQIITNADKIRSMTDEELFMLLFNGCDNIKGSYCEEGYRCCERCIREWLKRPVEE